MSLKILIYKNCTEYLVVDSKFGSSYYNSSPSELYYFEL